MQANLPELTKKKKTDNKTPKKHKSRLSLEDALQLLKEGDLTKLGTLAHELRTNLHGKKSSYLINRYINYSNICTLNCKFCSFAAKKKSPHAFTYSIEEICQEVKKSHANGITEVHMVGGLHPDLPKEYYLDLLKGIKAIDQNIHIKAFTAVEILHLAKNIFNETPSKTMQILRASGLDSITGGGAEILDDEVRKKICRGKETTKEWLSVHKTWHELGGRSTCTMLFGHVERPENIITHLNHLRQLQDQTGGFTGFIPLTFVPKNTRLNHVKPATAHQQLLTLSLSRIFLDNIKNITGYWIGMGLPLASVALSYGVNDLHGTIEDEKIFHMAGSKTPESQTKSALINAIESTGFTAFQRDSHYLPV